MSSVSSTTISPARAQAVRRLGRYQLLRLLGKSERTMAWRVADLRSGQDLVLVLPRLQPKTTHALDAWIAAVRKASRLSHPNLAAVVDSGVIDRWPFVVHDPRDDVTLAERLPRQGEAPNVVAAWAVQGLEGLAFAHDAGVAHRDLQPYLVLVSPQGRVRLLGCAVAAHDSAACANHDAAGLAAQREAAQRDVLAFGLILHLALAGTPALNQPDVSLALLQLPPWGRSVVGLPFTTGQPVPDALRAIVNRATDRRERQRYRNTRTMLRALQGWLKADSDSGDGPLALLLDRVHNLGLLPASPGVADHVARLALMESERTSGLAEVVLQDMALALELLRAANHAQVRGRRGASSAPVLTIRRAIAMLGLDNVRRAALGLRAWPGPLDEAGAMRLQQQLDRVRRAARLAQSLRPAGYDAEVVHMVTLLQSLGRLAVQYHLPEEARQIRRLMLPASNPKEGQPADPGMGEEAAVWAVLGIAIDDLGVAIVRHWGLDDSVQHMARRLPLAAPVRMPDDDDDILRLTASCGIEGVDALEQPASRMRGAVQRVLQRYARPLGLTEKDLQRALHRQPDGDGDATPRAA